VIRAGEHGDFLKAMADYSRFARWAISIARVRLFTPSLP
jgi:hypothetical protein